MATGLRASALRNASSAVGLSVSNHEGHERGTNGRSGLTSLRRPTEIVAPREGHVTVGVSRRAATIRSAAVTGSRSSASAPSFAAFGRRAATADRDQPTSLGEAVSAPR
jgi:hypothetical protein